jgi:predicted N-acyltransferase
MPLNLERLTSIKQIDSASWNELAGGDPFLRHEFLAALETSGCVGARTAWEPAYLVVRDAAALVGALPLFVKHD